MKNFINKILFCLTFVIIFINDTFAQTIPEGPPCGGPFDPCVPIDGGASFLLGLGILYGSKKILDSKKKAKN